MCQKGPYSCVLQSWLALFSGILSLSMCLKSGMLDQISSYCNS